ncbi:cation:proton antiporter [Asticcacaulis solisilvae]|uniref:cation:proton antiporter n=1 Tax=Asticcacaulis solisilvae TaxID=1217274 RepID=UPI003FD7AA21
MALFESLLILLAVAIALSQVSRHLNIPYPTMLAVAGLLIAAVPGLPDIGFDPHLALALFIAPALLDAAFDLPPRTLMRHWMPLLALVGGAVILTTAAVAWVGVSGWGMAWPSAIALGAIVAPPDAAAASAVLARFNLPRNTLAVLKGESLLNDAVSLLIFTVAVGAASPGVQISSLALQVSIAVPGGLIFGFIAGRILVVIAPKLAGTVSGTVAQFVATFAVWVIADQLHVSAILAVVAYGMTVAHYAPERTAARDRMHAYSVWEAVVFLLNVLAFLLMGLQARTILLRLHGPDLGRALVFACVVVGIVVLVRFVWVMIYNRLRAFAGRLSAKEEAPTARQGFVVAWCGMRGLVTLAAAVSLPSTFPQRDLIVLGAFAVVIGTLVGQGLTLGPLISLLKFKPDGSFDAELSKARMALLDFGLATFKDRADPAAVKLRDIYTAERSISNKGKHPREVTRLDELRRATIVAMRRRLADMRRNAEMDDDIFHALEQELDMSEMAALPTAELEMLES